MNTTKDFVRHEIVGLSIEIIEAKNKTLVGMKGKIIDETQNTITIQSQKIIKKIIKNQIKMKFKINEMEVIIEGKDLVGRPHERVLRK